MKTARVLLRLHIVQGGSACVLLVGNLLEGGVLFSHQESKVLPRIIHLGKVLGASGQRPS